MSSEHPDHKPWWVRYVAGAAAGNAIICGFFAALMVLEAFGVGDTWRNR